MRSKGAGAVSLFLSLSVSVGQSVGACLIVWLSGGVKFLCVVHGEGEGGALVVSACIQGGVCV